MIHIGLFNLFSTRNEKLEILDDLSLYEDKVRKTALKRIAIESVIGMISKTIIQSEFRVIEDGSNVKNEMYYRFNVKPNVNQSAARFWEQVVNKLIYDGECLIIKADTDDLLIADDYMRETFAIFPDKFKNVIVKDYEFKRVFNRNEVIFFQYGNESLSSLIDSLYYDYGELLARLIEFQLRKNQIRATVDIEAVAGKDEKAKKRLQNFINRTYKAIKEKAIAIIPQQKGFTYQEHSKQTGNQVSVDEINKLTNGFMDQVANAVGLPVALLRGDMADVEKITRNYMKFCIDPILKIIRDELNMQFISKDDYLKGNNIDIRRVTYSNVFDVASSVDKLRSSGVLNGNELRDELGYEHADDPMMDKYFITKNYQESSQALEGGDDE